MRLLARLALALPLALLWPACGGGAADPTPCATKADCAPSLGITCTKIGACCVQTGGNCMSDIDCGTGEKCSPTSHLCATDLCTKSTDCPSGQHCDPCGGICGTCTPFLGACSADDQCCSTLCDHASFTCK